VTLADCDHGTGWLRSWHWLTAITTLAIMTLAGCDHDTCNLADLLADSGQRPEQPSTGRELGGSDVFHPTGEGEGEGKGEGR
jgi:hypothetical protein